MPIGEGHDVTQTLGFRGQHESFRVRVRVRGPRGKPHRLHAAVAQHAPECGGLQGISVEDQDPCVSEDAVDDVGQVPRNLFIHASCGSGAIPAISTLRVSMSITKKTT